MIPGGSPKLRMSSKDCMRLRTPRVVHICGSLISPRGFGVVVVASLAHDGTKDDRNHGHDHDGMHEEEEQEGGRSCEGEVWGAGCGGGEGGGKQDEDDNDAGDDPSASSHLRPGSCLAACRRLPHPFRRPSARPAPLPSRVCLTKSP